MGSYVQRGYHPQGNYHQQSNGPGYMQSNFQGNYGQVYGLGHGGWQDGGRGAGYVGDQQGGGGDRRRTVCFNFRDSGTCRYGTSCKFLHEAGSDGGGGAPEAKKQRTGEDKQM
jgi:hypothetical protein